MYTYMLNKASSNDEIRLNKIYKYLDKNHDGLYSDELFNGLKTVYGEFYAQFQVN